MKELFQKPTFFFKSRFFTVIYLLLFVGFLEGWQWKLMHEVHLSSLLIFLTIGVISLIYGQLFFQVTSLPFKKERCCSLELLFGFFVFNSLLFVLLLVSPLNVKAGFLILVAFALLLRIVFHSYFQNNEERKNWVPDFLCLIISGIASTLWCADALTPPIDNGTVVSFPIWIDGFLHARVISSIAQVHGLLHLSSTFMEGSHAPIYHYAGYLMTSVMASITHLGAYEMFGSFFLPLGLLLSGFATFALASCFWGVWSGVAATAALLLLPDAFQQGFGNKFLGYHFVQQIGPAGFYGTACAAIAWIFLIEACRSKKYSLVAWGYFFIFITLFYKAHLFVANAYIAMIFPWIFIPGLLKRWRVLYLFFLTSIFIGVVMVSYHFPSVPPLRLDGSGMHQYSQMLLYSCANHDAIRAFFVKSLITAPLSSPAYEVVMGTMLLMCTLGVWVILCGIVFFLLLQRKENKAVLAFPLFMILNYLIMTIGLPYQENSLMGTPEELLHRPLVWVYFAVAVWTGAGLYFLIFGNRPPQQLKARIITVILLLAAFLTPLTFAHHLQRMPVWLNPCGPYVVPSELVAIAHYIRDHSKKEETIQNSENDPKYATTGIAERQCHALVTEETQRLEMTEGLKERLKELEFFKTLSTEEEIRGFLQDYQLSWYILHPETKVSWPSSFQNSFVFQKGGYRLYHFDNSIKKESFN